MKIIDRREFFNRTAMGTLAAGLSEIVLNTRLLCEGIAAQVSESVLPGTAPLTMQGDMAYQMVEGIHRFLLRRTKEAAQERSGLWNRDYGSVEAYQRSVSPNRERFRKIIGAVDPRVPAQEPELVGSVSQSARVGRGIGYEVYTVRWPVL